MPRTGWRCSENISIDIWYPLTGVLDLLVGPFGALLQGHMATTSANSIMLGAFAQLGGIDLHQSQRSTALLQQQSMTGFPQELYVLEL
jgi:hypothetical protein